ncbi:MAG: 23S rRNA (adenine(2503)-C(2))-methyltransferase [Gammaproteobacteria bacterium TMED260]|nr:23S rRNA (adenine(2503)-C(2))-methyltransferase RlmN [Gammaproteobacteria bacterium]OUX33728.1 MAG: 23S rRNA (adenine(2503)-C(2))-methyltransferase [Gammaproteobacteria bacterium TMED260]
MAEERPNLLGLSRDKMKALFSELGEKPFRAQQIMQWLHQRGELELNAMTDISKSLRGQLEQSVDIRLPKIVADYPSDDGSHKWVIKVASGSRVEMVFIPEGGRGTLCVSSQAGCSLDCSFCATGKQGFNSNLTVAEIVGQVWLARQQLGGFEQGAERKVSNVVMMGMGEPLLNFEAVMDAVNIMMDDWAYGLSKRKVTISTSGVVPAIRRMKEFTDASLAVSLHAPNDALRSSIMPINKRYPIGELLDAVTDYMAGLQDKRMPVIEYTLIKGINDHRQHARELAQVLANFPCKINLIPFNPFSLSDYQRPSDSVIGKFREILQRAGFTVTVRTTRADDIGAACGQLVGDVEDQTRRQQRHLKRAQQGGVNANSEKERRTEILASTANLATTADRF